MTDQNPSLDELLEKLVSTNGSDLHLKVGSPPAYRIDGELHPAELPPLTSDGTLQLLLDLLPDRLKSDIEDASDIDFAYGKAGLGRFRVNAYKQRGSLNIVVRSVAPVSTTIGDLGLPTTIASMCDEHDGLIIVTGPVGAGKTTTCAAMVDHTS